MDGRYMLYYIFLVVSRQLLHLCSSVDEFSIRNESKDDKTIEYLFSIHICTSCGFTAGIW